MFAEIQVAVYSYTKQPGIVHWCENNLPLCMVSMSCLRFLDRSLVWFIAGAVTLDALSLLAVVYNMVVSSGYFIASGFVNCHITLAIPEA